MFQESQVINSYGFNIPCRRFLITANVTRDRRLPVVDEFILRALRISGATPIRRLAGFFGFTLKEAYAVIADLGARGFVVVEGDAIGLHPNTLSLFRDMGDELQIVEVLSWVDRVWFDLVSKNMIPADKYRGYPNLVEIDSNAPRDVGEDFARKAFQENFFDYLRSVKHIKNADRFSLYSVSEVIPERFGHVVVRGHEELIFGAEPRISSKFLNFDARDMERFKSLNEAMSGAVRNLNWPSISLASVSEYARLSGDRTIPEFAPSEYLDARAWFTHSIKDGVEKHYPVIGASYISKNIQRFIEYVGKAAESRKGDAPRTLELLWFRPVGSGWGTSPELYDAISEIRTALRIKLTKDWRLQTQLVSPRSAQSDKPTKFRGIFDAGYLAPAGFLAGGVEVVLLRGIAAMILVRMSLSDRIDVPVGIVISDSDRVERLDKSLNWSNIRQRSDELWASQPRRLDYQVGNEATAQ